MTAFFKIILILLEIKEDIHFFVEVIYVHMSIHTNI